MKRQRNPATVKRFTLGKIMFFLLGVTLTGIAALLGNACSAYVTSGVG